ncbi:MAG: hypothetical protein KDE19_13975 [Caldilineaceae bacterium]|nr:hypothetical protein [Caldilineaceae bacterium]
MENLAEMMNWLEANTLSLADGSGTSFGKAGVMSELVFDTIETINQWPEEQQRLAVDCLRQWLNGATVPEVPLPHDAHAEKWIKPMLRAVIDNFAAIHDSKQ